jgi:hypothetical protein
MPATNSGKLAHRERDQVRAEAGQALRWSARRQKRIAYALGAHESRVSRECAGEDGRVSRFYEAVRKLVREGSTTAGHVIAGAMVVAEEEALDLPSDEIRRRLIDALAQESHSQAREDVAQHALAVALGGNGKELEAALVEYDAAVRHETGHHVEVLVYARALMVVRGWREGPGRVRS